MEPSSVISSTTTVIRAAPIMIATTIIGATPIVIAAAVASVMISAARAGPTPGIGISVTAGIGGRSRAIPTTATPGQGVGG
jgi:hypothetical protein